MSTAIGVKIDTEPCLSWSRWPARALAALLLTSLPLFAQYDSALQYQNRGNRHEGLKSKPVSGYDVELLSALVDWREPSSAWPETVHLRFYLPTAEPVFVTVRQPRPKTTYYWLDKVEPPSPWRAGAFNEFAWPTSTVLRSLPSVTFEDLGAVVRLRQAEPSREELIAPAALFHAQPPSAVSAYRFTFKTNGAAHVAGAIYRDGQKEAIYQRPQDREQPGSPFTLRWDAQGQPEGEYLLVLSGFFDNDNTQLLKRVTFYHRAAWR
jgi:hypothetical protein